MEKSEASFEYILTSFEKDFPLFTENFKHFCKENDVEESKAFDMEISLEELIVNSFMHGESNENVKVLAVIKNQELVVKIEDHAPPFNLLREAPAPPKGDLIERKAGGLGIHLVKNLNDRVEYSGSKQGNQVTLFKSL